MKSVLFFLYVVLFSTTIHAEVKVLCLGEGECVTLENYVHPGSLSGASTDQKINYLKWYEGIAGKEIVELPLKLLYAVLLLSSEL